MKPKAWIKSVIVDVNNASFGFESCVRIFRHGPSVHRTRTREYPLTAHNYWRAVGMQLRLAGFADDPAPWPLDKKNYREDGE